MQLSQGSRYPEFIRIAHDLSGLRDPSCVGVLAMGHLRRALFSVLKRVLLSGICRDNETPIMSLDSRTNTRMDLIFRITRPLYSGLYNPHYRYQGQPTYLYFKSTDQYGKVRVVNHGKGTGGPGNGTSTDILTRVYKETLKLF
jgi:hypothetical protein